MRRVEHVTLATSVARTVTKTVNSDHPMTVHGHPIKEVVLTLKITAADRADADETYDVYVHSGDKDSSWDLVHFSQIITTGAKTFVAIIKGDDIVPQRVTTAVPGVSSNESGTLKCDTDGADQGLKTLAAGVVRHGFIGDRLGWSVVIAGTTPSITFSIEALVKFSN